jgi:hypothetical protein
MNTKKILSLLIAACALLVMTVSCEPEELAPELSVQETLAATAEDASYSLAVTSNTDWTATDNAAWLTLSPASGNGNGTITVNVEANTATAPRTATITVVADTLSRTVIVTQAAQEARGTIVFTFTGREIDFEARAENMVIDWGDGATDKKTGYIYTSHTYQNSASHTVTIKAEELPYFFCREQRLTALDVSRCSELTDLYCAANQLTVVDVSNNTQLERLDCGGNPLTTVDISRNTELESFWCYDNPFTALDISNNTKITYLDCRNNQLIALDLSNNTKLVSLNCTENELTALDVSSNTELVSFWCQDNQLTAAALNALFTSLPTVQLGNIYINDNPGAAGCDRSIATNKGWQFL